jgi:hypothetical protein
LALVNSTISGNQAIGGANEFNPDDRGPALGGGIVIASGAFTITGSTISGNAALAGDFGTSVGGGLHIVVSSGCLSSNTVVSGNFALASPDIFGTFTIC